MGKKIDIYHADYKGELTAKHLKDGPLHERKCTDLLCLLFFFAFWVGMIATGYLALKQGRPLQLTYAYDNAGYPCGQDDRADFSMLLFIHSTDSTVTEPYSLTNTICVKSCPNGKGSGLSCYLNSTFDQDACNKQAAYSTEAVFNRFCLPTSVAEKNKLTSDGASFGFVSSTASDLMNTWPMIFAVGGFALVFGFVYILLMKYFSGVLIWGLLTVLVLGTGGFGYVAFSTTAESSTSGLASLSDSALKTIAYSCWVFAGISLLLCVLLHSRICLSIAILKAAAHFIEDEPGILLFPPILLVFTLSFYVGWIVIAAFIMGMNTIKPAAGGKPYADLDWTSEGAGLFSFHIFALFWNQAFGVAISQFIVASTVCLWYFKQGSKKCGASPVKASVGRTFKHMGSLAFGSFLIGLLEYIRYVLHALEKKTKAVPTGENVKAGFCIACCGCVVGCFERSMKFLTNHAYIQIAMTGESFCTASTEAFFLAIRNAVRFGMVHGFSWIFLKLGQLIVSGCATLLGYIIITQSAYYQDIVISPVVPTIFFFLSSYVVAHSFMGIYGMSADTIVHCFAMDEEIHDGTVVHAPEELRDYVDNHLTKKLLVEE